MRAIYFSFLLLGLSSCGREVSQGKLFSLNMIQATAEDNYNWGQEAFYAVKETAEDKSSPDVQKIAISQLNSLKSMDDQFGKVILQLEKIKVELLNDIGQGIKTKNFKSSLFYDFGDKPDVRLSIFDFTAVSQSGKSSILSENKKNIISLFTDLRENVCKLFVEAGNSIRYDGDKPYFFMDPKVNSYSSIKNLNEQISKGIQNSNVRIDDIEQVKQIYLLLSVSDSEWDKILSDVDSWDEAMSVILSLQSQVLRGRASAFFGIRYRFSACGYSFNKIEPFIDGPNVSVVGDTLKFSVFYAAFDSYRVPEFTQNGGVVFEKVENGKGYFQSIVPDAREMVLNGTITIKNKSGIPKTQSWSHKVKILPKPAQK